MNSGSLQNTCVSSVLQRMLRRNLRVGGTAVAMGRPAPPRSIVHTDMTDTRQTCDECAFPMQRFVRLTRERDDGFVEFDFAIGDPEIFVELVLPRAAYQAFCRQQGVAHPDEAPAPAGHWRHARLSSVR